MTFHPRMVSATEGIRVLDDLRWRQWNGVVADVWHVDCARGGGGYYVSQDARLFVVLEGGQGHAGVQLSTRSGAVEGARAPLHMSYVPAEMPLWSRIEADGKLRHLDLHFDVDTLSERLGTRLDAERLATPRLAFMDERLYAIARLIAEECLAAEAHHDLYGDGLVLALFIDLMKLARTEEPVRRSALSARQIRRVTGYIEENCLRNIRLQELAALTDLSQSYFSHAFKAATGVPPYQWHMRARMRRVEAMLADTALTLPEIAVAAGFADQAHFTRVFRRFAGVTPAAWRRTRRG